MSKTTKKIAYKGFNKDMTCRDFQYEQGKEYIHNGDIKVCNKGFHACENPIDVFSYYAPGNSVYHQVEQSGEIVKHEDKTCSSKIKIGARIGIAGICKATFNYVKSHCTNENNAEAGKPTTAGNYGAATAGDSGAATAGYCGAATAGNYGAATAGNYGAATAGDSGAATAGNYGAATAGDRGAATAGNYGAATAGYCGAATSRGKSTSGKNGLSVARGNNVMVRGGLGAILVIVEEKSDNYDIQDWRAVIVDGKDVKADTWYRLENGELIECNES